jgi:hypothetical protein
MAVVVQNAAYASAAPNPYGASKWEGVSGPTVVVVGGAPPADASAARAALSHAFGIEVAAAVFALISALACAAACGLPWVKIAYLSGTNTGASVGYGLLALTVCTTAAETSCQTYAYAAYVGSLSVVTVTGSILTAAAALLALGAVLGFFGFAASVASACASRAAARDPATTTAPPQCCKCFSTAFTVTALTATAFVLTWVGAIIGNLLLGRAIFAFISANTAFYSVRAAAGFPPARKAVVRCTRALSGVIAQHSSPPHLPLPP